MNYTFPYVLEPDDGPPPGFVVTFPDVPGAITEGDDEAEAHAHAEDCLLAALEGYVDAREPLPRPAPARGRPVVVVPPVPAAKLGLYEAMRAAGVSQAEMARRLGVTETIVRRLLDLRRRSHIGEVDKALRLLGKRIVVEVRAAA